MCIICEERVECERYGKRNADLKWKGIYIDNESIQNKIAIEVKIRMNLGEKQKEDA